MTESSTQRPIALQNADIARRFEEVAQLLAKQPGKRFRVQAYRNAAETLRRLNCPVSKLLKKNGLKGLRELPGIGESLALSIRDMVVSGRLPVLDRLRGEGDPVGLLATVPGISRTMADRLHYGLALETLEDLETAAHDGRLTRLAGIRGKRLAAIIDSLAARLGRVRRPASHTPEPPLAEILDVDREYREGAEAGELPTIAPRRFNPEGKAWLPVLHTARGKRHYTALYSNTARAHEFGRTRDWVVLYSDGEGEEWQCTVITSEWGPLKGRRIVRGREGECIRHYGIGNPGKELEVQTA